MISQFQLAFKLEMSQDVEMLMEVTDQLDKILFDDYVKRKSKQVSEIIRKGVLGGGIDWYLAEKPKGKGFIPLLIRTRERQNAECCLCRGSPIHLRRFVVTRVGSCSSFRYCQTSRC